jgi:hypothetical protein
MRSFGASEVPASAGCRALPPCTVLPARPDRVRNADPAKAGTPAQYKSPSAATLYPVPRPLCTFLLLMVIFSQKTCARVLKVTESRPKVLSPRVPQHDRMSRGLSKTLSPRTHFTFASKNAFSNKTNEINYTHEP